MNTFEVVLVQVYFALERVTFHTSIRRRSQLAENMANVMLLPEPDIVNLDGDGVFGFYYLGWSDSFFLAGGFDKKINALVNDVKKCFTQDIPLQALFLSGIGSTSDNPWTPFNDSLQARK